MAVIRRRPEFPGDPDVVLPELQRAEPAGAEGDGPQPGSGPTGVPGCTPANRKYVQTPTLTAVDSNMRQLTGHEYTTGQIMGCIQ